MKPLQLIMKNNRESDELVLNVIKALFENDVIRKLERCQL